MRRGRWRAVALLSLSLRFGTAAAGFEVLVSSAVFDIGGVWVCLLGKTYGEVSAVRFAGGASGGVLVDGGAFGCFCVWGLRLGT